jgi:hypothetical protein
MRTAVPKLTTRPDPEMWAAVVKKAGLEQN